MPPFYFKAKKIVCLERAKKDTDFYYKNYLDSLEELLKKNNSTKIRLEVIRVKAWIKKYEDWSYQWHSQNYIKAQDSYVNPEDAHPSECFDYPKSPFFEIFSEIK